MTNQWKRVGAWLGGTVSAIAISPHFEVDRLALAATLAGIYRSLDGGRHWQLSPAGLDDLTTHALVFAPADQDGLLTAFTATQQGRLYHSPDGGASWQVLNSWRYGLAAAIAVSPDYAVDGTLFVATGEGIFRSFERGLKWQSASFGLLDTDVLCLACAPDFAASELLWAGTTGGGFYRSRNAGRAWREAGFGLPDSAVQCLAVSPAFAEDQTLFIGTETAGLFRSQDGGQNWEAVGSELAGQSINCLALAPHFHAAAHNPDSNRTLLAGTSAGIFLSVDGGEQWTLAQYGPAVPLGIATTGASYAIAGSYQEGVAISEDGGRSWQLSMEGLAAHVPPLVVYRSGSSASESDELIAAAIDSGLVHSHDGGLTWQSCILGSNKAETSPVQVLAAEGNTCFVATTDRLYRSNAVDSGWVELSLPHEGAQITLLALSPQFKGSQKVLLGTQAGHLYLSEAGSVHWQPIPSPLAGEGLLLQAAFSFDPAAATYPLNLVTAIQTDPQGFKIQLWQSTDEGNSWQEVAAISPVKTPAAALLIPDPARGFPLFLAVQNEIIKLVKEAAHPAMAGSRFVLAEGLSITALAASPGYEADQALFAGTNKGIFHSQDDGESWQPLGQGLEERAVVALLPASQARLEAITWGGEVWRLTF